VPVPSVRGLSAFTGALGPVGRAVVLEPNNPKFRVVDAGRANRASEPSTPPELRWVVFAATSWGISTGSGGAACSGLLTEPPIGRMA